ncbi:MAG: signal peptidase I [Thiohalocapsa sp.]
MSSNPAFYFGNAGRDQVRGSGWFIGQFVPPALGLRHQDDVEIKWQVHPDGDARPQAWATGHATTISVLIRGCLRATFEIGETPQTVVLEREGDYVIYSPQTVHTWQAVGETVVLTVRFPSVEVWQAAKAADAARR